MPTAYVTEVVAHLAPVLVRDRELMGHYGIDYGAVQVCARVPEAIEPRDWLLWIGRSSRLPELPRDATGQVRSTGTGQFGLLHGLDVGFGLADSRWDEIQARGGHEHLWGSLTREERAQDDLSWAVERLARGHSFSLHRNVDWERLERRARRMIEGATTTVEHFRAWEWLPARLHDNHSKLVAIEGTHACKRVHCGIYGRFVEPHSFVVERVMPESTAREAGLVKAAVVRAVNGLHWPTYLRREGQYWPISSAHFRRAARRFMPWHQPEGTRLELETDAGPKTVCFGESYPGFAHYAYEGTPEPMAFEQVAADRCRLRVTYFPTDDEFVPRCREVLETIPTGAELVLDLRGCGGGNGEAARELASMLLPVGTPLSRVRGRHVGAGFTPWVTLRTTTDPVYHGPVTMLMDEICGSSTECLIGALKAARRAKLVGRRSGGASGNPRTYRTAGGVVFTCSSWEEQSPEGEPIEGHGITTRPWQVGHE